MSALIVCCCLMIPLVVSDRSDAGSRHQEEVGRPRFGRHFFLSQSKTQTVNRLLVPSFDEKQATIHKDDHSKFGPGKRQLTPLKEKLLDLSGRQVLLPIMNPRSVIVNRVKGPISSTGHSKLRFAKRELTPLKDELMFLSRRLSLLEQDQKDCEDGLQVTTAELEIRSSGLKESQKTLPLLAQNATFCEVQVTQTNESLIEVQSMGEDANRKHEDAVKKLKTAQSNLWQGEFRLESANNRINELFEELYVVGSNLKSMEDSAKQTSQREESYEKTLLDLTKRLQVVESQAKAAETKVSQLQTKATRLKGEPSDERMNTQGH